MDRVTSRKQKMGIVLSNKMQKTIVVRVGRSTKHEKYKKIIKQYKKFKVHDEKNQAKVGDKVLIEETRPISKDKHFRLVEVLK